VRTPERGCDHLGLGHDNEAADEIRDIVQNSDARLGPFQHRAHGVVAAQCEEIIGAIDAVLRGQVQNADIRSQFSQLARKRRSRRLNLWVRRRVCVKENKNFALAGTRKIWKSAHLVDRCAVRSLFFPDAPAPAIAPARADRKDSCA
jgi:hypothetical protein